MMASGISPGKIIMSGEHSVVYGMPALVCAVSLYTRVSFHPIHHSGSLRTALKGIATGRSISLNMLSGLKSKLDQRFQLFREGKLPVSNILQRPDDLMLYTLAKIAGHLPVMGKTESRGLPMPGHLCSESELPLGAGMGSSASVIAATLVLYEYLLGKPYTVEERFQMIRFCERLQHGNGSAVDASAVSFGGLQFLENQQPNRVDSQLENWYWILSGIPESSTGECVAQVKEHYAKDEALWQSFSDVSYEMLNAIKNTQNPSDSIAENQRLLNYIGVVPDHTQHLIDRLSSIGATAKISGAGSVNGDKGGIVIAWCPDKPAMNDFMARNYPSLTFGELLVAEQGAHIE